MNMLSKLARLEGKKNKIITLYDVRSVCDIGVGGRWPRSTMLLLRNSMSVSR